MSGKKVRKGTKSAAAPAREGDTADDLYVVGIGASAGGLESLRPLVANLPTDSNLCFVIAQHLSPQHRSMMVQLLARETKLPVAAIINGVAVKRNTIYIAPPNCDVDYRDGRLVLRTPIESMGPKPSIDKLFISLATSLGDRAIAIVLSGTGSDGANGLRAVKAHGGITIAQEPATAKYESMPRAAISIGGADLVLSATEIATKLVSIAKRHRHHLGLIEKPGVADDAYIQVLRHIQRHTSIDFGKYKETTLRRQIARRMSALQVGSLIDYVGVLENNGEEINILAKNFLISVTQFFRDRDSFTALGKLLEKIIKDKQPDEPLRIWVPGCATGEEAYSIALLLATKAKTRLDRMRVQIFGTDVDELATAHARRGEYSESSVSGLSAAILKRYFSSTGRLFRVEKEIRNMVVFSRHDLVQDPPFKQIDLVSCRNLLIYFKPVLQEHVFRLFHYALRPGGHLFLGKSESLGASKSMFAAIDARHKIFRRSNVASYPIQIGRSAGPARPAVAGNELMAHRVDTGEYDVSRGARDALVETYAPPSVLVNPNGEPQHFFGNVSPYIRLGGATGKVDTNILSLVELDFRAELRALMHRARRSRGSCVGQMQPHKGKGNKMAVRLAVHAVGGGHGDDCNLLVSFEEHHRPPVPRLASRRSKGSEAEPQIAALEQELKATKENLQTVVEELETSNEELQSVNEELQASNEELQASNEELETANEELQATNEELTTVNDELSVKTNDLAEANGEMESILAGSAQAIMLVDHEFRVVHSNDKAARLFDLTHTPEPPHLLSLPVCKTQPSICTRIQTVARTGHGHSEEIAIGRKVYLLQISPHRGGRKPAGVLVTLSDISALRKAERSAIDQGRRAESLIAFSRDGIITVNRQGNVHLCNSTACELFDVREHEIVGKPVDRLFLRNDVNVRPLIQYLVAEQPDASHRRFEIRLQRRDRERYFDVILSEYELDNERYRAATLREITELHEAQEAMAQAKRHAEEANGAKTNFLAKMSHELRTPLNAIVGFSDAILNGVFGPLQHDRYLSYVQDIHKSGVHLLGLINDVFDIAKVEAGHMRLAEKEIDLVELVSGAVGVLQPMAARAGVEIVFDFKIEGVLIRADELRIRQILINVLSNAVKFSLHGGKVRVTIATSDAGLFIVVADKGVGIERQFLDRIGTEFLTTSSFVSDDRSGTGLGLPVSISLMRAHGGDLRVDSVAGKGTTVTLMFPTERIVKASGGNGHAVQSAADGAPLSNSQAQ
jgi:two-component system CheB/CheR fusion protein